MEEFKDNLISSILNMFSSGKSNLRCFLILLGLGFIVLFITLAFQNLADSIFQLSNYWTEEYIMGFQKVTCLLITINIIYWIIAIIIFIKYYLTEEVWIN